jgi:hypothetical protein
LLRSVWAGSFDWIVWSEPVRFSAAAVIYQVWEFNGLDFGWRLSGGPQAGPICAYRSMPWNEIAPAQYPKAIFAFRRGAVCAHLLVSGQSRMSVAAEGVIELHVSGCADKEPPYRR